MGWIYNPLSYLSVKTLWDRFYCSISFNLWEVRHNFSNCEKCPKLLLSSRVYHLRGLLKTKFGYGEALGSKTGWLDVCLSSVQFSSVVQSCLTLCDPMNRSTPGLPVHHHLLDFTQTHVHWVCDVMQPSHPGSSPSPPAPNPSQHQSLFQWVNSSHEVAIVLEFQL